MLRLFLAVTPAALLLSVSIFVLMTVNGFACDQVTIASYYGTESGSRTATGEHFDGTSLTAAMPSRAHLGETWRVSYAGRSVVVRVNDVGPAAWTQRGIDLSAAAARRIGLTRAGVGRVCMERVG